MTEKIGLFTGTFDPLTNGHLDVIKRASQHFDQLYVGIFKNDQKLCTFFLQMHIVPSLFLCYGNNTYN